MVGVLVGCWVGTAVGRSVLKYLEEGFRVGYGLGAVDGTAVGAEDGLPVCGKVNFMSAKTLASSCPSPSDLGAPYDQ